MFGKALNLILFWIYQLFIQHVCMGRRVWKLLSNKRAHARQNSTAVFAAVMHCPKPSLKGNKCAPAWPGRPWGAGHHQSWAVLFWCCADTGSCTTAGALCSSAANFYIGLARTVYIRRVWSYISWFPCQECRIYLHRIYIYIYMVLANPTSTGTSQEHGCIAASVTWS